jgi:hypothetical protein
LVVSVAEFHFTLADTVVKERQFKRQKSKSSGRGWFITIAVIRFKTIGVAAEPTDAAATGGAALARPFRIYLPCWEIRG